MIPISDSHTHTNPIQGLGMKEVAKKFKAVGGWFIALVSLPPSHYSMPPTLEGYSKSFEIVIKEAKIVKELNIEVRKFIGIHPADVDKNIARLGIDKALEVVDSVMHLIENLIKNGVVDGLGEFGWPHYKALPEAFSANIYTTIRALELAHDYDVPIHLHLEQKGEVTIRAIYKLMESVGVKRERLIIHHVDTKTYASAVRRGFYATALGKVELLSRIIRNVHDVSTLLVESDHIDDPKRPGVAMYPWEIRDCVNSLLSMGVNEDILYKVFVDNVVKAFSVKPP